MVARILCIFLCSLLFSQVRGADLVGEISGLVGKGEVYSTAKKAWKPARLSQKLFVNDTVRTLAESKMEIKCSNGGVVRIDENSQIALIPGENDANQSVALLNGKLWSNMKKIISSRKSFNIYTPTATAAIRGTVFRVDAGSDSSTDVLVYQGKVDVDPKTNLDAAMQKRQSEARHEVQAPTEVEGPHEVTLEEWVTITAGQQISVKRGGDYKKFEFDQKKDGTEAWVKYNQEKDQAQEK